MEAVDPVKVTTCGLWSDITDGSMHKRPMFIGPIGTLASAIQYFRRIGLPYPSVLKYSP